MQQRGMPKGFKFQAKYAWMDGEFIPLSEATVHVRSAAFSHGACVFEGIRAYWNSEQQELHILKLSEHLDRLFKSMKMLRLTLPFSKQDIFDAQIELLSRNEFKEDIHSRPNVYFGLGDLSSADPDKIHMGVCITAVPSPTSGSVKNGVNCCISSWQKISDRDMPPRIKASANYLNSRLAVIQAKVDGYDFPILLNQQGKVAESSGSCIIIVRDGVVIAPPITADILESITRTALLDLFRKELGVETVERDVDRTELYIADEVFMCGTAVQIAPVISVDRMPVGDGKPGRLTRQMQGIYFDIVRGKVPKYKSWLTPVYKHRKVAGSIFAR